MLDWFLTSVFHNNSASLSHIIPQCSTAKLKHSYIPYNKIVKLPEVFCCIMENTCKYVHCVNYAESMLLHGFFKSQSSEKHHTRVFHPKNYQKIRISLSYLWLHSKILCNWLCCLYYGGTNALSWKPLIAFLVGMNHFGNGTTEFGKSVLFIFLSKWKFSYHIQYNNFYFTQTQYAY